MIRRLTPRLRAIRMALRILSVSTRSTDPESLRRSLTWVRALLVDVEAWVAETALSQWPSEDAAEKLQESRRSLFRWRSRKLLESPEPENLHAQEPE